MSKLWVDYTNHAGKREWRHIRSMSAPIRDNYPPLKANYNGTRRLTVCVTVEMVDRDYANRTLALTSIHGFAYQSEKPEPPTFSESELAYKILEDVRNQPIEKVERAVSMVYRHEANVLVNEELRKTVDEQARLIAELSSTITVLEDTVAERDATIRVQAKRIEELERKPVSIPISVPRSIYPDVTFVALRMANAARQKEWDTSPNGMSALYRANELAGEVGEACNVVKKLEREQLKLKGSRATISDLASELGDVVICADLLAQKFGIPLDLAVVQSFDDKSREHGFKTMLKG